MNKKRIVPVCFDEQLLIAVDQQMLKEYSNNKKGRKFNRSEFISSALNYYLKVKCGIPYILNRCK